MLYTLGYSGWTPEAIREEAQARNAVVCDIRYSPRSRHPYWTQGNLQRLFGTRYQHVQALGNRNYKSGGPIVLADYDAGKQAITEILATGQAVILMCACKDLATCHRLTAVERLAAVLGEVVTHLVPQKTPRAQETQESLF